MTTHEELKDLVHSLQDTTIEDLHHAIKKEISENELLRANGHVAQSPPQVQEKWKSWVDILEGELKERKVDFTPVA